MRILRQNPQELVVQESTEWLSYIFFAVCLPLVYRAVVAVQRGFLFTAAFFLLFAIAWLRKTTVVFDAGAQMARWRKRSPFKTTEGSIPFSAITGVGTETCAGGSNGGITYRLTILTAQGATPLSDTYSGGTKRHAAIREEILRFLKLDTPHSLDSSDAPVADEASLRSLLRQGRKIDAVTLLRESARIGLTEAVQRVNEIEERMKAEK
jgi:hypothetical protein